MLVNSNSFLSLLLFPLSVHCWVDLIFIPSIHRMFIFILDNLNLFGSPAFFLVVCQCCLPSSLCTIGTKTLQPDWKALEQGCEVCLNTNQIDPPPEEQQSQQGVQRNPNAYRIMSDHIHPPRVSVPLCIVPPTENVNVRPYLVPLLPTFHGMENENPHTHIRRV